MPINNDEVMGELSVYKKPHSGASELNDLLSLHGWGLRRHVHGVIVVTHKDGSEVLIREDAESIAETLFYRMMNNFLTAR